MAALSDTVTRALHNNVVDHMSDRLGRLVHANANNNTSRCVDDLMLEAQLAHQAMLMIATVMLERETEKEMRC